MLEPALKSRIPDPKSPSLSTTALLEMGSLPPKRAGPSTYSSDHETSLLQGRFCWVGPGCWERNRITESPKHAGLKEQSAANLISTGFIRATILPVENGFQGSWGLTKGSHQRCVVAEPSAILQMSSSDTERPGSLQKVTQRWLTCEEPPTSQCGSGRWRWSISHTKEMESDTHGWDKVQMKKNFLFYFFYSLFYLLFYSSVQSLSHARLFANPWTAARQASLSMWRDRCLKEERKLKPASWSRSC